MAILGSPSLIVFYVISVDVRRSNGNIRRRRREKLCDRRGGTGLPSLIVPTVSVDVKELLKKRGIESVR